MPSSAVFATFGLLIAALACLPARLEAQGRSSFTNFEQLGVDPITTARVSGHDYVLVCNTEDHAVEIFDTDGLSFVARVRVGLGPVTVRWNPKWSQFYTANFLGDSVTVVTLSRREEELSYFVERSVPVADEPTDIGLFVGNDLFFVSSNTTSSFSLRSAPFADVLPGLAAWPLLDSYTAPKRALKEVRRITMAGLRLVALGHRGGRIDGPAGMDLWGVDFQSEGFFRSDRLGSANLAMEAATDGTLFVASLTADINLRGEAAVAAAPSGFTRSILHRVDGVGRSNAKRVTRDLHMRGSGASRKPAAKSQSLAHPYSIAIREERGRVDRVYVAGFNVDRVGVVTNVMDDDASKWRIQTIDIPRQRRSRSPLAGPRGLALKYANPQQDEDPGERLYVFNALDSSVCQIDTRRNRVVRVVPLRSDPVPQYIKTGRRFLYDAKLSGSGFVACASCHLDGTHDGLPWDLGVTTPIDRFDSALVDGSVDELARSTAASGFFPPAKGFLMTQTLQGLSRHEVEPEAQVLQSNGPFHWRGDRPTLRDFAGAFKTLLNGPGISAAETTQMQDYLHSIHFPPNPRQDERRVPRGRFGSANASDGAGAARGLKLYHTEALEICAKRSCVHCHALPTGSNDRITEQLTATGPLRGPMSRERTLELSDDLRFPSAIRTQEFGITTTGIIDSTSAFNRVFAGEFPGEIDKVVDINRFNLELDSGVAPIVGATFSVSPSVRSLPGISARLDRFEEQVRAVNCGLAVQARVSSRRSGHIYDASTTPGSYMRIDGRERLSRNALLGRLQRSDDRVHFVCTTVGEARRVASPDGSVPTLRGSSPRRLSLQPLRPSSFFADIPKLTKNWKPKGLGGDFDWSAKFADMTPVPEPKFPKSIRLLQWGLIQDGPSLGLSDLRHEAPRRLVVAGNNIRYGARLEIHVPDNNSVPPPYPRLTANTRRVSVPIFPTGRRTSDGRVIWESAVEWTPRVYYAWMLGGQKAPNVAKALRGEMREPPEKGSFDPARWNLHYVVVRNEDGTSSAGGWQALRVD